MHLPLDITITVKDNYLECHVTGMDSAENTLAYWMQILAAAEKYQVDNLLVIEELNGRLKTSDSYGLVDQYASSFWGKRIAFIDLVPGDAKANLLGLVTAQNQGVIVESFTDTESALHWLLNNP